MRQIGSRPQPREGRVKARDNVAAVVLAAGQSNRMGEANKLLATLDGVPLVRRVVEALQESSVSKIIVITGHSQEAIIEVLDGLNVRFVNNPNFADGLSTSLKTGIDALDETVDAALIALGDMPFLTSEDFEKIIEAYRQDESAFAAVATAHGKKGNPVLWGRFFFDDLRAIRGDRGGRHLIDENEKVIIDVEIGEAAAMDLDTPEALEAVGGKIQKT